MESTKIKILCDHQTGYLPWLGLFHRISLSDIYVSLDTVKYNPRSYDNRNKIKTPAGFKWLNVPTLKGKSKLLKDIKINNEIDWKDEHLKAISYSYGSTPFFIHYFNNIKKILNKNHDFLMDLNEELLTFFLHELGIKAVIEKASAHNIHGRKNGYLINICKEFKANTYIFGQLGKDYVDQELWKANNINVYFHEYRHPTYKQTSKNFEPYLSIIDLLFNEGPQHARTIIQKGNVNRIEMLRQITNNIRLKK